MPPQAPPNLQTQLQFIDDAAKLAKNDMRIFVCENNTLSTLALQPTIGGYVPRIITKLEQYEGHSRSFAPEGATGFDIILTPGMHPEFAGALLDRAKRWFYPNRYDHKLCMAIVTNHVELGFYENGMKLEACCLDMNNGSWLEYLRKQYKF